MLGCRAMRLFVAIDPAPEVQARIAQHIDKALRPRAPSAKWIEAGNLHLTLAFLGETEASKVEALSEALTRVAAAHDRFSLRFEGGGSFGAPRRPRVLWIDARGDREALSALQRDVEAAVLPPESRSSGRAFSPHLTLARSREPRGDAALAGCVEALAGELGETAVTAVVLYESVLGPRGARYTKLFEAMLR